jgi:hypothetical protein
MGFNTNTGASKSFSLQYSATLGMLFLANEANTEVLKKVKAEVGEAEWKKGFQGKASKAVKMAADAGLKGGSVTGVLSSAWAKPVEVSGRETMYLTVGLKDADGRYYVSLPMASEAAQKLTRKLVNCQPGVETEISVFATMDDKPREGQTRIFASHGASVKQGGEQVTGVSPADGLKARVDAALKALADAGVDDKETINKRRAKVSEEYHLEILAAKKADFEAFYAARGEAADAPTEPAAPAFDDLGDDIPF